MNIKVHTSLVLAICTFAGVTIGGYLISRSRRIDDDLRQVGPASVALRNFELLSESLGQWLVCNDLVLHEDRAFMVMPSTQLADRARRLLAEVADTTLAGDHRDQLLELRRDLDMVQEDIARARDVRGDDRLRQLATIAEAADPHAQRIVNKLQSIERTLRQRATHLRTDLIDQQRNLTVVGLLAGLLYLGVAWLCWLWIVHRLVVPIAELSRAAENAAVDEREFRINTEGPEEVQQLAKNIQRFVGKLQDARAHTEDEVRQRTLELVDANKAKGQFLATMSHELRTPLNGIINMNELILETDLDKEQQHFARTAKNAADALLALISDILDFSKIEAGKLELERVLFDPRLLIDSAIEILAGVASNKNLELQSIVAPNVPAGLTGDPMRLRQIVINLLNNALKFTSHGSVSVHVSVAAADLTHTNIRFEVRDTGLGISPESQAALFNAFQQVDSSTTRKYGGTGLGLAICKQLCAAMEGTIGVESALGAGSTFWFTARFRSAETPPLAPVDLGGAQVVLVSRRPLVQARFAAQLAYLGVPADGCVTITDATQLCDDATRNRLVAIDPYGAGPEPFAIVHAVQRTPGVAAARIAVLDHWLRHWPPEMGTAPTDVLRLTEPTRLEQLADWLSNELVVTPSMAASAEVTTAQQAAPTVVKTPAAARILVVEDTEVNLRVIRSVLERGGYSVGVATDGLQAVETFRRENYDLILMDCQMPVMDGLEATRQIRALEIERSASSSLPRHVPIIAVTANTVDQAEQQCLTAGMDKFLSKPIRPRDLLETIAAFLQPKGTGKSPGEVATFIPPRVLVADDSEINLRVAQSVLGRGGYEVVLVENGQQAVDFLKSKSVALVLMDCQMPVLDGLAATRILRELESQGKLAAGNPAPLPIVALTGNTQGADREAALAAGMDRFVTKPFRPAELLALAKDLAGPGRAP